MAGEQLLPLRAETDDGEAPHHILVLSQDVELFGFGEPDQAIGRRRILHVFHEIESPACLLWRHYGIVLL